VGHDFPASAVQRHSRRVRAGRLRTTKPRDWNPWAWVLIMPAMLDYDAHRRRMIAETSAFIEWGLAHPDQVRWIPTKRVSEGGFSDAMSRVFWAGVFGASALVPGDLVHRFLRWVRSV